MTIEALNSKLHAGLKLNEDPCLVQSKNKHFAPLVVGEFVAASQNFPIVFIKEQETGQFKSIALLGIKPGENVFYSDDGWLGHYRPLAYALSPFMVSQPDKDKDAILCIDSLSPLINTEQGSLFFDDNNVATDWVTKRGEQVVSYVEKTHVTKQFIDVLLDLDLLAPQTLTLKQQGGKDTSLNGLYAIDEKKLNALDITKFDTLRSSGALVAIYASLISMQRIEGLVKASSLT